MEEKCEVKRLILESSFTMKEGEWNFFLVRLSSSPPSFHKVFFFLHAGSNFEISDSESPTLLLHTVEIKNENRIHQLLRVDSEYHT